MKMKTQHIKIHGDAMKAVPRGNFIALNAYVRKEERPQISDLSFNLKKSETEEQVKIQRK